ncbi:metal ABC transporter substrate-binding protein [Streptomyces tateyamensis]|uniref:Anti-sigma factor antagonist n=1 Tax=Streptomyces tateyamensis TaxID=565073 RepID=A0A2V4NB27_9ACTN|nr:STAS domain-containing protein [Streptomyces tateyamensis]PYC74516.1 metal ABC transporter substrate-binding protein [Streptomyces tateyamensis]
MRDSDPTSTEPTPLSDLSAPEPVDARLTVDLVFDDGTVIVSPVGELDYDSVHVLRGRLREALDRSAERVVVDCRGIAFCDSTGLNLLLTTRLEALRAQRTLVLARVASPMARLLELTGTDAVFDIRPDLTAPAAC